jgi:hypothetical protein
VLQDKIRFSCFEYDVMLGVDLSEYEISRMVKQERYGISVKGLFEMTS